LILNVNSKLYSNLFKITKYV